MQQSTVSKTSSFNSCLFPAGKILRVPGRGASSSHGKEEPSWHSPLLQPQGGSDLPSDLPKVPQLRHPVLSQSRLGIARCPHGTARVRGTDQRVQGATQARGTGTGWPQSVKHKGRKGGTGSSKCCSSSGSKKPPWDGSAFVPRRWHSAIPARSGRDSVLPILLQTRAHKQLEQEQQEAPGTTRPFASDANGAALPPASTCWDVSQDGTFQRSHGLHALKPSTSSRSDTPMLLLRTSVFLPVTHPGGDLSPLPSPSSIPPSNSC